MNFVKIITVLAISSCLFVDPTVVQAKQTNTKNWYNVDTPYSESEIQWALKNNLEQFYYFHKERRIQRPEHSVSNIKVLNSTQNKDYIGIVGTCRVDGKEHIISGVLSEKSTGGFFFGGGWFPKDTKQTLEYGTVGDKDGWRFVSGIVYNKDIRQLRLTSVPDGNFAFVPVNKDGSFLSFFQTYPSAQAPHPRVLIEGFNKGGQIIYSPSWKFARIAVSEVLDHYPTAKVVREECIGRTKTTPNDSSETHRVL